MGDLGVLAAFVIAPALRALMESLFAARCCAVSGFKCTLIVRSDHLRQAVFKPLKSACFSGPVSLGPPFGNLRKWAIWV